MITKKLGMPSVIATGVGLIVATSCLIMLSQGVGFAGKGFIIAMAIACFLNILVAFSFAELNSMMPITGGLGQYTLAAVGPFISIIAVLGGYFICNAFAGSSEAAVIGIIANAVFLPNVSPMVISFVIIAGLFVINLLGIKSFARTQIIVTGFMLGSLLILAVMGAFSFGSGEVVKQTSSEFNPLGLSVISMSAMAFWLFIGIEFVTPLTKDLKNAKRDIPIGMIIGLIILFIIQAIMVFAVSNYVPYEVLQTSNQPHMEFASRLLGSSGSYWMSIISIGAVISTLNTVFAGVSRMLHGLSKGGMLPKVFSKTNKYGVPYVSLSLIVASITITMSTGISTAQDLTKFILAGSMFWMLSYIIAHVNVLILRIKRPEVERSFAVKLFGVPQIIGILGMIYMMINIIDVPELKKQIYTMAGIFGLALIVYSFLWVKFVMKKGLFETISIEKVVLQDDALDNEEHLIAAMLYEEEMLKEKNRHKVSATATVEEEV
ncbi:MAG: APC family permease [Firmicutes bacterium HGW-Firmicutes-7]|nr:MAG: APC family permease [Firmicutes bacterium HGW-Firmicutes-7]